jgi:TPR repeat protein
VASGRCRLRRSTGATRDRGVLPSMAADGGPLERASAAARVAELLDDQGRPGQAEEWLRESAGAIGAVGPGVLAEWQERHGRIGEAEDSYRRAAEQGSTRSMNNLAGLLLARGRAAEARPWLQKAAEGGFSEAMNNLAVIELERGNRAEVAGWLLQAAATENDAALEPLRQLVVPETVALVQSATAGDSAAMNDVGSCWPVAG